MNWDQACQAMLNGSRVRIKGWNPWITVGFAKYGALDMTTLVDGPMSYVPEKAHMTSNDWEVAK